MTDKDVADQIEKTIKKHSALCYAEDIKWGMLSVFGLFLIFVFNFYYFVISDTTRTLTPVLRLLDKPAVIVRNIFGLPLNGQSIADARILLIGFLSIGTLVSGYIIYLMVSGTRDGFIELRKNVSYDKQEMFNRLGSVLCQNSANRAKKCIAEIMQYGGEAALGPLEAYLKQDFEIHQFKTVSIAANSLAEIADRRAIPILQSIVDKKSYFLRSNIKKKSDEEYVNQEVNKLINSINEAISKLENKFNDNLIAIGSTDNNKQVEKNTILDEKMIKKISLMYTLKSTPELQEFISTANKNEYLPETFEAIRRLLESRKEKSLKRISEKLKDIEEVEKIFQEEKEREFQDFLKDSLEEIEYKKKLLKNSIKSVVFKRKIFSLIGIVFLFLTSIISIYAKDIGTFASYLFVCLLFFGVPVYYLTNRYKEHNVKLLELERDIDNLSLKLRST